MIERKQIQTVFVFQIEQQFCNSMNVELRSCVNAVFFRQIDGILQEMKVPFQTKDIVHIIDGYKGIGYGKNTDEELQLLCEIAAKTGP
jgi:hypothetical protein